MCCSGFLFLAGTAVTPSGDSHFVGLYRCPAEFLGPQSLPVAGPVAGLHFCAVRFYPKNGFVEALPGLFIETIVLIPFRSAGSCGSIEWGGLPLQPDGSGRLLLLLPARSHPCHWSCFAYAARHMGLMTLGLLQYISPTCTFFLGIFMFGGNLEPGYAGDVHFYLVGLAAVYGGKLAADAAFAALRERKRRTPPLSFCTIERMGIWTEMVRSVGRHVENSQYGNFHAYVYL